MNRQQAYLQSGQGPRGVQRNMKRCSSAHTKRSRCAKFGAKIGCASARIVLGLMKISPLLRRSICVRNSRKARVTPWPFCVYVAGSKTGSARSWLLSFYRRRSSDCFYCINAGKSQVVSGIRAASEALNRKHCWKSCLHVDDTTHIYSLTCIQYFWKQRYWGRCTKATPCLRHLEAFSADVLTYGIPGY